MPILRSILVALLMAVLVAVVFSVVEAVDQYAGVAGLITFLLVLVADSGLLRR